MNSFRHVRDALEHEAARQARALERGERVVQETRLWNPERDVTVPMRSKEYAHDYRYFPDPDLVPVEPDPAWVAAIERELPELPRARRQRFASEYGLPLHDAELLTGDRALADYFEEAVRVHAEPEGRWRTGSGPSSCASSRGIRRPSRPPPSARRRSRGWSRWSTRGPSAGRWPRSSSSGWPGPARSPTRSCAERGSARWPTRARIGRVIDEVVAAHPSVVEDYRRGKKQAAGFLVGQVMKATQGKANPQVVNRLLAERLGAG